MFKFVHTAVITSKSCRACLDDEVYIVPSIAIESAVNGLPGVTTVRSSSKVGLSMVQVVFDEDADIYKAQQSVTERLQQVTNHPRR
ncbi:efflux RND transporter permease subunit [Anabaena sp. CCY 9910]|uniref:efflux RND transporter permease subunit n=1 Tax=Anabaena sp. CCY 9910 TaxID=3103870 RepID=UPI0039DF6855